MLLLPYLEVGCRLEGCRCNNVLAWTGAVIWLAENFTKTQRGFGGANAAVGAPIVAEPELALPRSSTRVYHAHDDGTVYCLDGRSGEILWSFGEQLLQTI